VAWVKIDDRYPRNPKVLGLTDKAFRHDLTALCYCAEQRSDGELPPAYLRTVPAKIRQQLVDSGRWDVTDQGVFVHDYLEYNPSATETETKSDAARNASRIRWSNASATRGTGNQASKQKGVEQAFERFWVAYPRRVGRRAALAAFVKALERATPEEIAAGAERYDQDPKRSPDFTAHPTTWLNADRWTDETEGPKASSDARYQPYDHEAHLRDLEAVGADFSDEPEPVHLDVRSLVDGIGS
jgi:hypothetical protein